MRSRRLLSSILVGLYGGLFGALLGGIATFWMWGLGYLLGFPVGLCRGAILGWNMLLRDAVVLFAGCFSASVLVLWMTLALGASEMLGVFVVPVVILISGPVCQLTQKHLPLKSRFYLAWALTASCFLNVLLFIGIKN